MNRVEDVMSGEVYFCHLDDTLNAAAQIMWERDCGCVPVVDDQRRVVGIMTDRDACMAAYTQGKALKELLVSAICAREVQTCKLGESLAAAEEKMAHAQIRRLPVTDQDGRLIGMLSLSDLAHHFKTSVAGPRGALGSRNISTVLEAVSRPRAVAEQASIAT